MADMNGLIWYAMDIWWCKCMCVYLLPYPHIHVEMTVGDLHATVYMDVWFLHTHTRTLYKSYACEYILTHICTLTFIYSRKRKLFDVWYFLIKNNFSMIFLLRSFVHSYFTATLKSLRNVMFTIPFIVIVVVHRWFCLFVCFHCFPFFAGGNRWWGCWIRWRARRKWGIWSRHSKWWHVNIDTNTCTYTYIQACICIWPYHTYVVHTFYKQPNQYQQ